MLRLSLPEGTKEMKVTLMKLKQFCKLALVPLALCLSAGIGEAQNAYQGKFTLPFEARWQNVVLPAGNYTISMPSATAPYTMFVRGGGKSVIIQGAPGNERTISEKSELRLIRLGDSYAVRSLEAGQIGLDIDYSTARSHAPHTAMVKVAVELAFDGK